MGKCAFYAFYAKARQAVDKVLHLEAKVAAHEAKIQVLKNKLKEVKQ